MLTLSAYAKINLTLEVLGKRDDGYHEVMTILQTIDLADALAFEPNEELKLSCQISELESPENLVVKAARTLQEATRCSKGASIRLIKGIPVAAGLGGGSSDAAATLRALNELWGLGLSLSDLLALASRVGSDVAFFLYGGTALAEGRGQRVTPLPPLPESWLVLLKPPIDIPNKTKRLYASLDASHYTRGEATKRLIHFLQGNHPIKPILFFNAFDGITFQLFPQLWEYRQSFFNASATNVNLAGSGPSLFTVVDERARGEELCCRLRKSGLEPHLTRTINTVPVVLENPVQEVQQR